MMNSGLLRGLPQDLRFVGFSRLPKHEVFAAQQRWRRLYASTLHEETGRWTYRGYDWHTFSYGYTPCLEGPSAVAAMFQRQGESVLIIADAGNPEAVGGRAILQVSGDVLRARNDWILVAQDFSWTFVLTHESAMGPYFAEACEDTGQSQF